MLLLLLLRARGAIRQHSCRTLDEHFSKILADPPSAIQFFVRKQHEGQYEACDKADLYIEGYEVLISRRNYDCRHPVAYENAHRHANLQ